MLEIFVGGMFMYLCVTIMCVCVYACVCVRVYVRACACVCVFIQFNVCLPESDIRHVGVCFLRYVVYAFL